MKRLPLVLLASLAFSTSYALDSGNIDADPGTSVTPGEGINTGVNPTPPAADGRPDSSTTPESPAVDQTPAAPTHDVDTGIKTHTDNGTGQDMNNSMTTDTNPNETGIGNGVDHNSGTGMDTGADHNTGTGTGSDMNNNPGTTNTNTGESDDDTSGDE